MERNGVDGMAAWSSMHLVLRIRMPFLNFPTCVVLLRVTHHDPAGQVYMHRVFFLLPSGDLRERERDQSVSEFEFRSWWLICTIRFEVMVLDRGPDWISHVLCAWFMRLLRRRLHRGSSERVVNGWSRSSCASELERILCPLKRSKSRRYVCIVQFVLFFNVLQLLCMDWI